MGKILAPLVLLLLLSACESGTSSNSDPVNKDNGTGLTGSLQGVVKYSELDSLFHDHSGITVTLEGTSFSAITDRRGRWQIKDLPTRNYTVVYTRPGYSTIKRYGVLFIGGGIVEARDEWIVLVPTCPVELDAFREDEPGRLSAYAHTLCPSPYDADYAVFFFSNSPDVSSTNYQHVESAWAPVGGVVSVDVREYDFANLNKKDSIYVVAYHGESIKYDDPILRQEVYPSLFPQASRVMSILMKK